ncbi:hypothetical protein Q765_16380 [Flavobacterium rivuli WB 3.3-2 = DSM 21788]|uniref:Uncharacterized protein n=1 Tax=Flavobacterium rivuli WB 3.3-2 = DSM 21788 TaxID=1121895 RepID=A0A0A2LYH9_9FLAO|nr:hypothetical protein [Flavobacterium rivuli]KGO85442.1 hypothetical protein Q765_16380 [Flavobacterium rivuli WB 3.3-2 = DSM 21788]
MIPGTDDTKDLGDKKINGQEKQSDKNEGFSGDNLPKNYDPSSDKLKAELDKKKNGDVETQQRARDVDEKKAPPVSENDNTTRDDGEVVSKSRGTASEAEDIETAENRDFNNDTEKGRYDNSNPDNKVNRGNTHAGE